MVVAPRSDSSLGNLADPVFGDLPAGTLMAVAEDPQRSSVTHFWVGATWKSSDAAPTELNNVIDGFHHGQGSLFDDLRLEIHSFASGDAAAGHPTAASSSSAGSATTGGGSDVVPIAGLAVADADRLLNPRRTTGQASAPTRSDPTIRVPKRP